MTLGAAGRRAALESKFAGTMRMADAALREEIALKIQRRWPLVVLAVIMLGLTGSAALAFKDNLAPDVDPTTQPANLTGIHQVNCGRIHQGDRACRAPTSARHEAPLAGGPVGAMSMSRHGRL